MFRFVSGQTDVLVCTTIIESGLDIPNANTIVVNRADTLGLAQLHQLRGRVGRSHHRAYAYLLVPSKRALSADAEKRLEAIESMGELGSGFLLATHDLEIRGAGELLGTRQSGLPEFRMADLAVHDELLAAARDDAALILSRDPELESDRGQALRVLLYLFERDAAVGYLRSG